MISKRINLEPTSRCNASCTFCPRDQTPHQGLMTMELFHHALERTAELSALCVERGIDPIEQVSLCGEGEPTLHPQLPEMVRHIRGAGLRAHLGSNGARLSPDKASALLDAGLHSVGFNVSEIGDAYEATFRLPWERTYERVLHFAKQAKGRTSVYVVLVDFKDQPERVQELRHFWRERGIGTKVYQLHNRGGALDVEHLRFDEAEEQRWANGVLNLLPVRLICPSALYETFIGYDGTYYLCSHDWKKEAPLGSVVDAELSALVRRRLDHVLRRQPVCSTCRFDPANRLILARRQVAPGAVEAGAVDHELHGIQFRSAVVTELTEALVPGAVDSARARHARRPHRRIAVRSN